MAAKFNALLGDVAQCGERKNLKPSGVGQDGSVPAHEFVQSAEVANQLIAWTEMQVIRVGKDHLCADGFEICGIECLDSGGGTDGHESWSFDFAVWSCENASARGRDGVLCEDLKFKRQESAFDRTKS